MDEPLPVPILAIDCNCPATRSDQTRKGITLARARSVEWGRAGKDLAARNRDQASAFAEGLRLLVIKLMIKGLRRPARLARELNRLAIATPEGGHWHSTTVTRLIKRLGPSLKTDIEAAKQAAANGQ